MIDDNVRMQFWKYHRAEPKAVKSSYHFCFTLLPSLLRPDEVAYLKPKFVVRQLIIICLALALLVYSGPCTSVCYARIVSGRPVAARAGTVSKHLKLLGKRNVPADAPLRYFESTE
eukprot:6190856-Pleurochrysis_carterae.AAC.4